MSKLTQRDFNIMDGVYVNVPDYHVTQPPEKHIGLKEFNSAVLVHNWSEDREKFDKKEYSNTTTYKIDYKNNPGVKPDVAVRRRMVASSEGVGSKNLIGMHNGDSKKSMITWYDELYNKRHRPEDQKLPEKRRWNIINDRWLPEKSDHPIQDSSTKWGLVDAQKTKMHLENDRYASQLPHLSEYRSRFQAFSANTYQQQKTLGVPKEYSTSLYELNTALNNTPKPRTTNGSMREPQTRDVLDIVYSKAYNRPKDVARTLYYLGKVPADGSHGIYRARDFETLMPPANYGQKVQETTVQETTVQETTVQETTVQETTVKEADVVATEAVTA